MWDFRRERYVMDGLRKEALLLQGMKALGGIIQGVGPRGSVALAGGTAVAAPTAAKDIALDYDKLKAARQGDIP